MALGEIWNNFTCLQNGVTREKFRLLIHNTAGPFSNMGCHAVVNNPCRYQKTCQCEHSTAVCLVGIKPPHRLGLQKVSPEPLDGGGAPSFRLEDGLPCAELLVLQPLSPQLDELLHAELLVRRVARHDGTSLLLILSRYILKPKHLTMTPWRTR